MTNKQVAIIGAGPAGLMAAQVLSKAGVPVHVYDAMPSAGRKFLLAGIGGLNLSHSEPMELFLTRFYERNTALVPVLRMQAATQLVAWAKDLGVDTFVGSSGRIFPTDMKAAPLLHALAATPAQPRRAVPYAASLDGLGPQRSGPGAGRFAV
jgi:predicted flavoprotein YhiN